MIEIKKVAEYSLSQWLNFKLSGITCFVGKIKFKLLSQGPLAEWLNIDVISLSMCCSLMHLSFV